MRLNAPAWLALLATAAPVLLLYVLRVRRERRRVGSTLLWAAAERELLARAPWKRLVPQVTLALELTVVATVALAVARPTSRSVGAPVAHVALVFDVSASMLARVGDVTREELARREALQTIDTLPRGAEATLIEATGDARVVVPLTRDRDALRAAVRALRARDVEGGLDTALSLANDRLRPLSGMRRIVVFSDGAIARRSSAPESDVPTVMKRVGDLVDNAALVRLDARVARDERGAEVAQVSALVRWSGEAPRDATLTIERDDGAPLGVVHARLEPSSRTPVAVSFPTSAAGEGRGVVARLTPGDTLPVDDVAWARLPPGARVPVVLAAAQEAPWLRRALAADPAVDLQEALPEEAAALAVPDALIVYEGACPTPLPSRDILVIAPPPGRCGNARVGAPVDAPSITSYAPADGRFRFLTMEGVHLASATPLLLGAHGSELLRAGSSVLVADLGVTDHDVTVVGFELTRSDWPLRASFVVFVRNVVERSRERRARVASGGGRTGEPLRVSVPRSVRALRAEGPRGAVAVSVHDGLAIIGDTSHAGFYRLVGDGVDQRVAVNLLSDAESDLRQPPWEAPPRRTRSVGTTPPPPFSWMPWFAALAALAMLADLWWLTRKAPR